MHTCCFLSLEVHFELAMLVTITLVTQVCCALFLCLLLPRVTVTAPIHEVSCVEYTLRAWDPRCLQSKLDGSLFFGLPK